MYAGRIVEIGSTVQLFDRPGHPYTRALLRCLPDVELKRERLVEIGGQPPDLTALPPGCPFAPRCPERQPICGEAYPPGVALEDGHVAHCWVAAPGLVGAANPGAPGPAASAGRPDGAP
jgi:peptide/nickel transport system ATP-binding protein